MADLHQNQIIDKLHNIAFKDGTFLQKVISNIIIKHNNIGFSIDISGIDKLEAEEIKNEAIRKLNEIVGIGKITIVFTESKTVEKKPRKPKYVVENVKQIILVASGKGGVGKSTVAALIAQQLSLEHYRVGIVDADIYGPSIPHIFGINKVPHTIDGRIIPIKTKNIEVMSIGFFVKDHSAIIWRGPMASKTIYQLLSLTQWDNLDYLIIDMPPGTGDIHLSMLENYHLDGVIIVTTPQRMSEIDVVRSIDLYQKLNLPILGIIENMSNLFGNNSGNRLSQKYNIPLIAQIPIMAKIANACDKSLPLTHLLTLPLKEYL